jgi:hypothetical protein
MTDLEKTILEEFDETFTSSKAPEISSDPERQKNYEDIYAVLLDTESKQHVFIKEWLLDVLKRQRQAIRAEVKKYRQAYHYDKYRISIYDEVLNIKSLKG